MQTAMSLYHQARAALPWARASFTRVIHHGLDRLASALLPEPEPVPVPVRRPRGLGLMSILALALVAMPMAAQAQSYRQDSWRGNSGSGWDSNADGQLVDVQVLVEGRQSPLFFKSRGNQWWGGDDGRYYFQAFQGRNYSLRLHNNTSRRVGVLIAVDGLNVVNGERSQLAHNEPMYVLDPYETSVINGWRTSLDQVRRFVFVDEQRSYAERTGQANGDMGWIRVLSFNEAGSRRPRVSNPRNGVDEFGPLGANRAAPVLPEGAREMVGRQDEAPQSRSQAGDGYPGTGWGDRSHDPVSETWFQAVSQPSDRLVFRYEYASGLRALGIPVQGNRLRDRDHGDLGFAKPPRW